MAEMTEQMLINEVIRRATFSADMVAGKDYPTNAARTRAIVQRTIEMCIGNGLIKLVDPVDWPAWIVMDPPYQFNLKSSGE